MKIYLAGNFHGSQKVMKKTANDFKNKIKCSKLFTYADIVERRDTLETFKSVIK